MKQLPQDSYIIILPWMVEELKLSGSELLVYAIIHGFSMDGVSDFHGTIDYLCSWTGAARGTIIRNLNSLVDRKLIGKISNNQSSGKANTYYSMGFGGYQNSTEGEYQNDTPPVPSEYTGGTKMVPNNKDYKKMESKDTLPKGKGGTEVPSPKQNTLIPTISRQAQYSKNQKTMQAMTAAFSQREDVREALEQYWKIRKKRGLTPDQWKILLADLKAFAKTDENLMLEKIQTATAGGWGTIVAAWEKEQATKKNKRSFDNTAGHQITDRDAPLVLATDETGKPLKF